MKILSLSGFAPEAICDTVRFTKYNGERNIPLYCGYASDFISQVKNDISVDGAVFPKSCDSSRSIMSYLDMEENKFLYEISVPARQDKLAISYFATELRNYRDALEKYFDTSILDSDILERMDFLNVRNKKIQKLYSRLEKIEYAAYLKDIHNMLQLPLREQVDYMFEGRAANEGIPVYIVGSFLSNLSIAEVIERAGLNVVGDNLPESGRLVSTPHFAAEEDVFMEIAKTQLSARLSPTQNNFKSILACDMNQIRECHAKGVVFVVQKYCEPYQYLYSVYEKRLKQLDIPYTKLAVTDTEDDGKASLVLETFAELLEGRK